MRKSGSKKEFNRGRWQVERERCHLEDHERTSSSRDACSISRVIPCVMKKIGLENHHWLLVLEEKWVTLVGAEVAKHTRPGRFERGNLVIFVDSSVWLSELSRYGRSKILSNLQEHFGLDRMKSVTLQLDPDGQQSP